MARPSHRQAVLETLTTVIWLTQDQVAQLAGCTERCAYVHLRTLVRIGAAQRQQLSHPGHKAHFEYRRAPVISEGTRAPEQRPDRRLHARADGRRVR